MAISNINSSLATFDRPESDQALRNLGNLLKHLNHTLDGGQSSKQSHHGHQYDRLSSPYERRKLRANFEYARALLLKLEHESVGVRIAARKQAVQVELKAKRDGVKRIQGRLQELDERYQGKEEDESEDEEELIEQEKDIPELSEKLPLDAPSSNLRSRRGDPSLNEKSDSAYTTSSYHSQSHNHTTKEPTIQSKEQILSSDRATHETILDQMLGLTSELKSSASAFQTTLKSDEKHVDSAFKGMERNSDGMESASGRMTTLRRMTEGKGLWGRMMLYGYIGGLWVLALVIVFVLPKLRF